MIPESTDDRMQTQLDQKENDVQSLQEQLVRVQAEQEKTIRSEANVQKEHNRFKNIVDKERLASKVSLAHPVESHRIQITKE